MTFSFAMKNSRRRRSLLFFILLMITLPLSFQCVKAPLSPKAPRYSVPLNLQLIDRTWTFADMIAKDPKFDTSASQVVYRPTSLVNNPTPIVLPELNPLQAAVGNKLGLLSLDVTSISGVNVSASQVFPGTPMPFTYPLVGPNLSLAMQQTVNNPGALYDYVVFENGQMTLSITNTFQFTVNFANPGVQLLNADMYANPAAHDSVVATFTFPGGIAPGTTGKSIVSLSGSPGKTMSANLRLRFTIQSNDLQGKLVSATDQISASMSIDGGSSTTKPTMSSAKIQLNTPYDVINKADSAVQIVDDSTKIKRAEFSDGKFTVQITNNVPTRIAVDFKFLEFVDKITGARFRLKDDATGIDTVPPRLGITPGKLTQTVFMKDYAIQAQPETVGVKIDTLAVPNVHFSLRIKTLAATAGRVVITKDDSVHVDIQPQNNLQGRRTYILKKVVGKVKPTPVAINQTMDAAVGDLGNKFTADSIKFDSVSIVLKILSTGSFPTDLAMRIVGLDKNGVRRDSLTAREPGGSDTLRINPGVEKRIVFDKSTSTGGHGIDQFLSSFFTGGSGSLPQKLIVVGQALVDPKSYYQYPESTGTVRDTDKVYTSVDFTFPVKIGIANGIYRDTISIADTSGNKIDKKNLTQIDSGKVYFTIYNAFPFQLDVATKLLPGLAADKSKPDTSNVLLLLPKVGSIRADSARYGSKPSDPIGLTGTIIGLTPDDVDKINPATFIAVGINLRTAGNGDHAVDFSKNYYVRLKAFVSIIYNVDFDKLK